jgi:hypothetical protein
VYFQRFICLTDWNNEAVLDKETGLVWQRTPEVPFAGADLQSAVIACYQATTGGRKGWRLPTPEELMSLVDPTQSNPALPAGHPFQQVLTFAFYWSASTLFPPTPTTPGVGVGVNFQTGDEFTAGTNGQRGVWCAIGWPHVLTDFGSPAP